MTNVASGHYAITTRTPPEILDRIVFYLPTGKGMDDHERWLELSHRSPRSPPSTVAGVKLWN